MENVYMKDEFIDVKDYLEITKEYQKPHIFYAVVFFAMVVGIISFFKVDSYYQTEGYVLEDLVVLNISTNDIEKIMKNDYVYIAGKKYKYTVYDIEEEVISYQENYYKTVRLKIHLDDRLNYDYNVIKIKFACKKEKFLKVIWNKMKEGI